MDTCDVRGSVALVEIAAATMPRSEAETGGCVLSSEAHLSDEDYSTWLLPAVERVLQAAGKRLADVNVVAAAAGPGSFTGIRIALTTAKAWNEVLGLPVAAVSRLEALASECQHSAAAHPGDETGAGLVAASCDAQRGQLYGALYRWQSVAGAESVEGAAARLVRLGDERVVSPAELIAWASDEAGDEPIAWVSLEPSSLTNDPAWLRRAALGEEVACAPALLASGIAQVASRMAAEGRLTDALSLDANYIRRPDAEVKWKGYIKPQAQRSAPPKPTPPPCSIRPFAPADASAVAQIAATSSEAANWLQSSYAEMSTKGYAGWVAAVMRPDANASSDGSAVVAFLITRAMTPEAELLNLAVSPSHRRSGIATALLQTATEALQRQGVERLFLEVRSTNSAAISFYKRHLFRVTGARPHYYRDPDDGALLMEKNIHKV
jgi:tRNA threonylcarbamoyladenosine biosynthesis protein TsaB